MIKIAPSMLSADFLHLEKDVEMVIYLCIANEG